MPVLKTTPINDAEGVGLPIFAGDIYQPEGFTYDGGGLGRMEPLYATLSVITTAKTSTLNWKGNWQVNGYDRLIFFISVPKIITLSGSAIIDGEEKSLFVEKPGGSYPLELISDSVLEPSSSQTISAFSLTIKQSGLEEVQIKLYWIGVQNSQKLSALEEALPKYTEEWPGMLKEKGDNYQPSTMLCDSDAFAEMKVKILDSRYQAMVAQLKTGVEAYLGHEVEKEIRLYVPVVEHLWRMVRERDRHRDQLEVPMQDLALYGALFDDEVYLKQAVRVLLSIVHTPNWFEGFTGHFPGSICHHGCFMESHYGTAVAAILPLIDDLMTEAAIELTLDKLAEIFPICYEVAKVKNWRWFMNQGAVFNADMGFIALSLHRYGRKGYLEKAHEAAAALEVIIDRYINEEGYTCEGPGYFEYTFERSIRFWVSYAHALGKNIDEVVPDKFKTLSNYMTACISTCTPCLSFIPLNATTRREQAVTDRNFDCIHRRAV
jgi:hypothetical protein